MFELNAQHAAGYLASRLGISPEGASCSELGGGVSNRVVLVVADGHRLVLKQSLDKLRVEQDWFSDRERIGRESSALEYLSTRLPPGSVPHVVFTDPENYLYCMEAAPPGSAPWKELLLDGRLAEWPAAVAGRLLGSIIATSRRDPQLASRFEDLSVFYQLRLDPYYRCTAACHPDLGEFFEGLVTRASTRRYSLVHGDWSPKNLLVCGDQLMIIDWEVVHFGDPSFDAAFLINHLVLKSIYKPQHTASYSHLANLFWQNLRESLPEDADWFEESLLAHLGGLMLARVDGKSPAEYITGESMKRKVRQLARSLIQFAPPNAAAVWERIPD